MIELKLATVNNEKRILDTDLAERLGMKVPRKVRQNIIEQNRAELEGLGELWMERIQTGGRPVHAFYLNEEQALLVCMFSRTERAAAVRKEIITVYGAYRRGHLELTDAGRDALPNFGNPADAARAWAEVWEAKAKVRSCCCAGLPLS